MASRIYLSTLERRRLKPAAVPRTELLSPAAAAGTENSPNTLALIRHGRTRPAQAGTSPWIDTGLPVVGDRAPIQRWITDETVAHFRMGGFLVHRTHDFAMIVAVATEAKDAEVSAKTVYHELLMLAAELQLPQILRIWQYLPHITAPQGRENRYQRYCAGRLIAFARAGYSPRVFPAACLLGNQDDQLLLYALLSARPGVQVENPRQVSAFHYPRIYGRVAPSFSRALALPDTEHSRLYISGTASVVGHASRHTNLEGQIEETLANLELLLESAIPHCPRAAQGLAAIIPLKIYLRHREDYPQARAHLAGRLPAGHPVIYLRADACRENLLVEMEGEIG